MRVSLQVLLPVLSGGGGGHAEGGAECCGPVSEEALSCFPEHCSIYVPPVVTGLQCRHILAHACRVFCSVLLIEAIPKGCEAVSHYGFDLLEMY